MKALNRIVVQFFKMLGGNPKEKHPVTHWFYFKKEQDLIDCEKYLNDIGFSTLTKQSVKEAKSEDLLLIVQKTETINEDSINFDTEEFWTKAEEYNGIYDGWETRIDL